MFRVNLLACQQKYCDLQCIGISRAVGKLNTCTTLYGRTKLFYDISSNWHAGLNIFTPFITVTFALGELMS